MNASIVQTLSVPEIGSPSPSRLYQAGAMPMRCVVRNVGGVVIIISHDVADLASANSLGATYQLPAGQADVFVLAPKQSIFAVSQGAGGSVSVAVSEAVPVGKSYLES